MAITKRSETSAMILLLGSEPVVRSVMKEVLEHAGYVVLATGSLGAAVDRLADCEIDLLITGSERESEKSIISRGFPQDEEFGFQGGQPLGFQ